MDKYFAEDLNIEDLNRKINTYFEALDEVGLSHAIDKSYAFYHGRGQYGNTVGISSGGGQGETSELFVNDYRSLLRHMLTLITSERPAFDVRAVNTDYKSEAQAIVGEDILNHYLRSKKLEATLKSAVEKALWSTEGFVALDWDIHSGEVFDTDPDTGDPIMKGDITYSTYHAKSCIRDPLANPHDPDWVILVDTINKYDLAKRYPEHEEKILSGDTKHSKTRSSNLLDVESDMINVYKFYHKRNAVLPKGKYAIFFREEILEEGGLPFQEIPVHRVTAGEMDDVVFGYSPCIDILGLQEANNDMFSAILTNNRAFARQIIAVQRDAGVNHRQVSEALSVLELDVEDVRTAINPMNLTKSSPETYNFLDQISNRMERYTGINEVIRGEPSPNLRSGNSLALVAAQALKFNAPLQQSYNELLEDVGTGTLDFLKQFAKAPRFYTVVGHQNKSLLREFSSDSIENVDRVEVQRAAALTNTTAGRVEIADNLLQAGLISRGQQYITVLETGKLDPLIESERTSLLNIKSENEMLFNGEVPSALLSDNHALHIQEHVAVLNDPELRKVPEIVEATLQHLQEHGQMWASTPPWLLAATGQQPAPASQQPPLNQIQEQAQPGNIQPQALEPGAPEQTNIQGMPNLPNVPQAASKEDELAFNQLNLQTPQ